MKVIGTNNISYPEIRNFVDLPHNYKFVAERDLFKTLLNQYFRFWRKTHPLLQFLHCRIRPSVVRYRHFFNVISLNSDEWVVTFETTLPRLGDVSSWFYNIAVKRLASDSCKKIIAISQNAYDLQIEYLKNSYPEYIDVFKSKMMVLHPPQKMLINDYSEKNLPKDKISFTIVGADFFRKGGREVLNVFDRLIPQYPELSLNIVSTMNYGDYASRTSKVDLGNAFKIIEKYQDNINYYKSLPNNEVLEMFKESHVGLLTTWGDTYGYSVIESQAAGCPVITTNLRALPEINNNQMGWVIEVPCLPSGNGDIGSEEKRRIFKQELELRLEEIITEILENKDQIETKGKLAMGNIRDKHDVSRCAEVLNGIYQEQ